MSFNFCVVFAIIDAIHRTSCLSTCWNTKDRGSVRIQAARLPGELVYRVFVGRQLAQIGKRE